MGSGTPISVQHEAYPSTSMSGGTSSQSIIEDPSVRGGNSNEANEDTTIFVDDSNIVRRDPTYVAHVDDSIMQLQDSDSSYQSIVSFLAKPIVLTSGVFSTTDTYSFFASQAMPYTAFQTSQGVVWTNKLSGVYGIRMDMKFRLVVNANRFQQGRYIMGWVPLASPLKSTSNLKETAFNNSHMATLVQRTTVPHVELDLCNDTAAELIVPFVSVKSFVNMNSMLNSNNDNVLGFINIYPYSPLVSPAGSTTAGYTVYVSFENVRLFGAASPQSGLRRKALNDKEVSNTMNGPVSGIATAISRGFKEFSNVPLLSSYATPISWIADRVANVASIFGWSKPTSGDSLLKVTLLNAAAHNTTDGDSDARPMAFLSKPGVVKMDGISGTEYDEMDFSYIARKSAWFNTFTWQTSNTVGTLVGNIQVTPYSSLTTTGGVIHMQPVCFIARLFQQWRGSLRYRLKFVRTEFHSGRLQIAFFPGDISSGTLTGNAAYVHRMIVDIRETPEVDFVVPYIFSKPWCYAGIGSIQITVVDVLTCPATVSTSITILAEVCAGEDFEVAIPTGFDYTPSMFVPQSGINTLTAMNIGNSTINANPIVNTSLCIGDKVTNFRALLKRYHPLRNTDTSLATGVFLNTATINIAPDLIPATIITPTLPYIRADLVAMVASCYAIWRGGVRVRNNVNTGMMGTSVINAPGTCMVWVAPSTLSGFLNGFLVSTSDTNEIPLLAHTHIQTLRNNPTISTEMPQYSNTFARCVCDAMIYQGAGGFGAAAGIDGSLTQQYLAYSLPNSSVVGLTPTAGQQLHNIYRSLADDGDLGCFISVPPMRLTLALTQRAGLQ